MTTSNNSNLLDSEEEEIAKSKPSSLRFVELVLGALIIIGTTLSLFLIPGSGPVIVLSASVLVLMYFFLGFAFFNGIRLRKVFKRTSYKGIKTSKIIGAIGTGIVLSLCLVGIMFKLMFWPGQQQMLFSSLTLLVPVFVISIVKYARAKSPYYINIMTRLFIIGGLSLVLYYTRWTHVKYRDHPTLIKAFDDYNQNHTPEGLQRLNEERDKAMNDEK
ncbi:MAG: hypothetical protein H7282_14440 [Cytophagaceae bacterium]|nr:hypothetical protein [Cytophagaceae bacterium]